MNNSFPIPIPSRLPVRIEPCPIVEAIFEVRFVTSEPWRTLPGLIAAHVKEHYPEQKDLSLASIPEEIRRQDRMLAHLPLMQFLGKEFLIQLGPKVVGLVTRQNQYPGWSTIQRELEWFSKRLKDAGFLHEGERLGVRYIDFFQADILQHLILNLRVGESLLSSGETQVTIVLHREAFATRLTVANSASVNFSEGPRHGSILDMDVSLGPLDFDFFSNGIDKFSEAHRIIKEVFFGLLKPEFLATLNPHYT